MYKGHKNKKDIILNKTVRNRFRITTGSLLRKVYYYLSHQLNMEGLLSKYPNRLIKQY